MLIQPKFGRELVVHRTKLTMFGMFWVDAWRWFGGLNTTLSILVHLGSNSFWHAKRYQNEFGPQWTDVDSYSFKPSH